jgi:hypothetical protein
MGVRHSTAPWACRHAPSAHAIRPCPYAHAPSAHAHTPMSIRPCPDRRTVHGARRHDIAKAPPMGRRRPWAQCSDTRSPGRQWTMPTMTCPHCGYRWESTARSQKSRCGRCRRTVYVPAAVRNAPAGEPARPVQAPQAPGRPASSPLRRETGGMHDVGTTDPVGTGGRAPRARRARPYAGPPAPRARAVVPVRPVIGAVGRWSCGHEANVPQAATLAAWRPETTPCPWCRVPGLVAQATDDGRWAPVALSGWSASLGPGPGAASVQPGRGTRGRQTGRTVVHRFAPVVSPSAWPDLDHWRP